MMVCPNPSGTIVNAPTAILPNVAEYHTRDGTAR